MRIQAAVVAAAGSAGLGCAAEGKAQGRKRPARHAKHFLLQCFVTDAIDALSPWPPPLPADSDQPPLPPEVCWSASESKDAKSEWHGGVRLVVLLPTEATPPVALDAVWRRAVSAQRLAGLPQPRRHPAHFELRPADAAGQPAPEAGPLLPDQPLRGQLTFPFTVALALRPDVAQREALQAAEGARRRSLLDACHRGLARGDMWRLLIVRDLAARHAVTSRRDAELAELREDEGTQCRAALRRLLVRRAEQRLAAVAAEWERGAAACATRGDLFRLLLGEERARAALAGEEEAQRDAAISAHHSTLAEVRLRLTLRTRWAGHVEFLAAADTAARLARWRALHSAVRLVVDPTSSPPRPTAHSPSRRPASAQHIVPAPFAAAGRPASAAAALRCGWEPRSSQLWEEPMLSADATTLWLEARLGASL
eukprot:TRINITY_DN47421_c0_g1_i1.p2 TRINITY_DN47421_c0_g1~~TRINITY_DN47421_c0_g1_i1.p2  ORF type:complete len:425 (+),score=144.43 TRINITY_DN47421_c0_g1_i1:76-1350(+)